MTTGNLWVDPLDFDPETQGPPYLGTFIPKMASADRKSLREFIQKKAVELDLIVTLGPTGVDSPYAELAVVLAGIRAESWVHQANHWQTAGPEFYGDHLLFERLYGTSHQAEDTLAEKIVGLGTSALVNPGVQAQCLLRWVEFFCNPDGTREQTLVGKSLKAVVHVLAALESCKTHLAQKGQLTSGLSNLLEEIMDAHETSAYLLKQRSSSV